MTMICPNCGTEMPTGAKFCTKCGAQLKANSSLNHASEAAQLKPTAASPQNTPPPGLEEFNQDTHVKTSQKKWKTPVVIGACVVGLAIAGFGIWQVLAKENIVPALGSGSNSKTVRVVKDKKKAAKGVVFPYQNGDQLGLMNEKLEIVDEKIGNYLYPFNKEGVAVFRTDEDDEYYSGLIDKTGTAVVRPIYDSIGDFYTEGGANPAFQSKNGVMSFYQSGDEEGQTGLIDSKGEIVVPLEEGRNYSPFNGLTLTSYYQDEAYGVIDENGEIIIDAIYDQVVVLSEEYIAVKNKDEQMMDILDKKGNMVKENFAITISRSNFSTDAIPYITYQGGNGMYGVLDEKLKTVLEATSFNAPFITDDGKYMVISKDDGESTLLDEDGEELFTIACDYLSLPNEKGVMVANDNDDDKSQLVDLTGHTISSYEGGYLSTVGKTNIFYFSDWESDERNQLIDWQGQQILEDLRYFQSDRYYDTVQPFFNSEQESSPNATYSLVNKNGIILSKNVQYYNEFSPGQVFVQEPGGKVQIWDADQGNVLIEKTIEVEKPTTSSTW